MSPLLTTRQPPAVDLTPLILWSVTGKEAPIEAECDSCFSQSSATGSQIYRFWQDLLLFHKLCAAHLLKELQNSTFLEMFKMCSTLSILFSTKIILVPKARNPTNWLMWKRKNGIFKKRDIKHEWIQRLIFVKGFNLSSHVTLLSPLDISTAECHSLVQSLGFSWSY